MNINECQIGTLYTLNTPSNKIMGMYAGYVGERYCFWEIDTPTNMNIHRLKEDEIITIAAGYSKDL